MALLVGLVLLSCIVQPMVAQQCNCTFGNPMLDISAANIVALQGSSVTLSCTGTLQLQSSGQCEHRGCAEITWVHARDSVISDLSGNNTDTFSEGLLTLSSQLELNSITPANTGVYTCSLFLMGEAVSSRATPLDVPVLQITGDTNQLTVGSTLMLTCSLSPMVSGNTFQWTSGGSVISNSSVLQLTVTPQLNGTEYTCTASSDHLMGIVSGSVTVTVREPDILISGLYQNLRVGSTAVINCTAPSVADNMITWLSHDGSVASSSGTLTLQSVNYTLNGTMFTCSVNSPHLTESINQTIAVTVQATSVTQAAIINPPPYVVDGDQNVELQCTVTLSSTIGPDYSALSIYWTSGVDTIINNCSSPQPHGNTQISDTFSCNLILATISATSAGLYTCNAAITGISGVSTDLIILQVQGSLQSANLLTPENAVLGQSSVLTCEVHTSLPVTTNLLSVQWMHRGSPVTGNGGFALKQGSGAGASVYVTNLTLSETTVEHSGLYSCNVSTNRQQVTAEASLTVAFSHIDVHTGPSNGFPSQPLLRTSTRLSCSVTLHPQLSQLTILTIQYQWSSNGVTRGTGQELVLPNLSPADATTYSCQVTVSSANPGDLIRQISNQSSYDLMIRIPDPSIQRSPSRFFYYTGEHLNATCTSSVVGAVLTWSAVNVDGAQETLPLPDTIVNGQSSLLVFRPITFNGISFRLRCVATIPNVIEGNTSIIINTFVPMLSVSVSSSASTVLDISGYNSFTVQCGGMFSVSFQQSGESLSFMLTRNSIPVTDGLSTSPVMTTGFTVSQNSSVQQTASSASPATLVYNCTVEFSISGSLITTASNTTQVIVKGPSLPAAPVVHQPLVTSPTSALIQWSVPVVTYSPEQYTVYYTTNSSGCPADSDEGYSKSVTVYGLNHTDFFTIRDQQYNVALTNLYPDTVYCYKVVATNTEGRSESMLRMFETTESAPSGPPQNFMVSATSRALTLSWSPPLLSQRNGVITSYLVACTVGGVSTSNRTSETSLVIAIDPITNYTCTVSAATMVGDGPPATVSGTSNEDVPAGPPRQFFGVAASSTSIIFSWSAPETPNGVITEYQLQCSGGGQSFSPVVPGSQTTTTLSGLLPYTSYSCSITAHTSVGGGPVATTSVTTQQDIPSGPPQNFTISVTSRNIILSWSPPLSSQQNGVITNYSLTCIVGGMTHNIRLSDTSFDTPIDPFTSYSCTVSAVTVVGDGPATAVISGVTDEEKPGTPPHNLNGVSDDPRSLSFTWEVPLKPNGVITEYQLQCSGGGQSFSPVVPGSQTTTTLSGLLPYTSYSCSITAHTSVGGGPVATTSVTTQQDIPSGPPQNFTISVTSRNIILSWSPPLSSQQNGVITNYSLTCIVGGMTHNIRLSDTSFDTPIDPFTSYSCTVSAVTVVGDGPATAVISGVTDEEKPGTPPHNLNGVSDDPRSLSFTWEVPLKPNGVITEYQLQCSGGGQVFSRTVTQTTTTLSGLLPYTSYSCNITAHTSAGGGPAATTSVTTQQDVPSRVVGVTVRSHDSSSLVVTWRPPAMPNGVITKYEVNVMTSDATVLDRNNIGPDIRQLIIPVLSPGVPYYVMVAAHTVKGRGPYSDRIVNFTMEGTPSSGPIPNVMRLTDTSVAVSWTLLTLEIARGFVTGYTITAEPDTSTNRQRQAMLLTVTAGPNESMKTLQGLEPDLRYWVSVSASTSAGMGTAGMRIQVGLLGGDSSTGGIIPIIAGVAACLLIVLLALLIGIPIVICYLRRYKKSHDIHVVTDSNIEVATMKYEEPPYKEKFEPQETSLSTQQWRLQPIMFEAFPDHVTRMHRDRDEEFEKEYLMFASIPDSSFQTAKMSHNVKKNRFQNISAYDHSRVILNTLEDIDGSDYINASWIDGYKRKRAYIAAQGPVKDTVEDFWRMVWEQRLPTIVMLTQLVEAAKNKCACYWPEKVDEIISMSTGLVVRLTEETDYNGYKLRKMLLVNTYDQTSQSLVVTHYYFTEWPDHGVPRDKMAMIHFIKQVRQTHPPKSLPLLVHCSAGVGRTGTFIVLDTMLQRIPAEGNLNIYEALTLLRQQRCYMVQTHSQYVYIHDALSEYIQCGDTEFTLLNAHSKLATFRNILNGKTGYLRQFELLDLFSKTLPDTSTYDAESSSNADKNRYKYNLPFNNNRVRMISRAQLMANDYINASWVNSYQRKNGFIAAQAPMENTVDDLWQMVAESKSKTIVLLCPLTENGNDVCEEYWPAAAGDTMTAGKLLVRLTSEDKKEHFTVRKFEISKEQVYANIGSEVGSKVTQYHYQQWPAAGNPRNIHSLLKLVEDVATSHSKAGGPIIVMCNDGVSRTGAFMTIYSQVEKLKNERTADVFQFVKSSRLQRKGFIKQLDHYVFCYNALEEFINQVEKQGNIETDI